MRWFSLCQLSTPLEFTNPLVLAAPTLNFGCALLNNCEACRPGAGVHLVLKLGMSERVADLGEARNTYFFGRMHWYILEMISILCIECLQEARTRSQTEFR
jgi:hypothetical protein